MRARALLCIALPDISVVQYHGSVMQNVKEVMAETHRIAALLLDTKGPEIRTGKLKEGTVTLTKGQEFTIIPDYSIVGDATRVGVQYPNIAKVVKPGERCVMLR